MLNLVLALGLIPAGLVVVYLSVRALLQSSVFQKKLGVSGSDLGVSLAERIAASRARKAAFAKALRRFDSTSEGRKRRYQVPWTIVLGERGSGRSAALAAARVHRPFGKPSAAELEEAGAAYWFFDEGFVIEPRGFDLSEGAESARNDPAIRSVLGGVRRARRLRPIDGIVLTLPASDLMGSEPGELERKAQLLYRDLRHVQAYLRVRCPVYVLVTKSDLIPGFRSLASALPERARDGMFGWSSPYATEATFDAHWIDEAEESIDAAICGAQMEILAAQRTGIPGHEELFVVNASFRALFPRLREVLNLLFRPSVYSDHLPLRGIYFCGDQQRGGLDAPAPAFVTDLLSAKIFPERGLSRPAWGSQSWNRKMITALQWVIGACLVLAPIGLYSAALSLERDVPATTGLMEGIARHVREMDHPGAELEARETDEHMLGLLRKMADLKEDSLTVYQLPTSWFSRIDRRIQDALRIAFEGMVLPTLRHDIDERAGQILGAGLEEKPVERILAPEQTPEFMALRQLDESLAKLAAHAERYNTIRSVAPRQKLVHVDELAAYLTGAEIGPTFLTDTGLYEVSLAEAQYRLVELPPPAEVRRRADAIAERLGQRLFTDNPIDQDLRDIVDTLSAIKAKNDYGDGGVAELRRLAEAIGRAERDLSRPEIAWMSRDELKEPFLDLLASIRKSPLLGPPMSAALEQSWREGFSLLRERLYGAATPTTGPLLTRDRTRLALEPRVTELRGLLEGFLAQSYVRLDRKGAPLTPPAGLTRTFWDEEPLGQATKLAEPYQGFVTKGLEAFPEDLRDLLKGTAREQVERSMRYLVRKARRVEAVGGSRSTAVQIQAELSSELANLKRAIEPLRVVQTTYAGLSLPTGAAELRAMLTEQGTDMLDRVDALLEADRLYAADEKLSRWRGPDPPAFAAFAVASEELLATYLKAQRARIEELSYGYAALPVSLLEMVSSSATEAPTSRLTKWQRILAELRKQENMAPGNSVKALESFIQSDMMTLTPDNCHELLARPTSEGADYFLFKRARLREELRFRCDRLAREKLLDAYTALAKRFNRDLAGRYPFSQKDVEIPDWDAQPRDVRGFLDEVGAFLASFDAYVNRQGREARVSLLDDFGAPALAFIEQSRNIRRFLGPLLAGDEPESPARCDLAVEFRTNRSRERFANQIIELHVESGGRPVGESLALDIPRGSKAIEGEDVQIEHLDEPAGPSPRSGGSWQNGDRIRVSLRWAKDAPLRPSRSGVGAGAYLDEARDVVVFEYAGPWSLVRLLRKQRSSPGEIEGGFDVRPHTLKFPIRVEDRAPPTRPVTDAPRLADQSTAIVFIRLQVTAPAGKVRLSAPAEWPADAPHPRAVGAWTEIPQNNSRR
ncbi:type VI secretion protein IcmF/TssM N-terminal domain-containing protein [Sorangium sp. So ce1000]|uniref:type VI secretion protein IcmF/TssM N-terminal domain-containing protein n=1 Tax=Sorangium sp. So ce1000 TaxID=3133325 RepID=UPI003F5EB509